MDSDRTCGTSVETTRCAQSAGAGRRDGKVYRARVRGMGETGDFHATVEDLALLVRVSWADISGKDNADSLLGSMASSL